MSLTESIELLLEKKIEDLDMDLIESRYVKAGSRSVLKLYVDKEGGVTINDCEKVSKEVSVLLDKENFSQNPYTLEVSSPGIDRKLISERDFKRVVGKNVSINLKGSDSNTKIKSGKLISCSKGNLIVETEKGTEIISIANVKNGKIVVIF
ncbi:MAG: ribosome maturation factor RimP [Chitinispirillia bacterium]|jgi:ribosome maturation factor RimP